ncbi:hypothetical protein CEXT_93841 [Caerostris extrusa]|uniref:Uncharacterized protein n=1 Tax=Caerostris extrusa TaxID=172846 RepID=A0AAV4P773_CAEEX|nr:hypothetical protein CEXT_93841 [Caerostris extrusa]
MGPGPLCTVAGQTLSFRFSEVHCRTHRASADVQEEERRREPIFDIRDEWVANSELLIDISLPSSHPPTPFTRCTEETQHLIKTR